ncbi:MAG: PAS domain S-box protein [Actinomycetota bacterium]|nr:PAS domain S-box protein [Actinomycetota bacterium]
MTPPGKIAVLLVEDNPFDAVLVERALRDGGLSVDVTRVAGRDDFLAALERHIDVALVDYNLPSLDVFEVMEIAAGRGFDLPFIVVTGNVDEEVAVQCIKRGAVDYVVKDRMARLPRAVLGALEQRELKKQALRAERTLRESEERFRSLVQNSRDVFAVVDEAGVCAYVSPSVEAIGGLSPDDVTGRTVVELVHPDDRSAVLTHLDDVAAGADAKTLEVRMATAAGGWTWIEMHGVNRLEDPALNGIVLNYHDVSDRKEAERGVRESQRLLAEAQAVSHVGSFEWDVVTGTVVWSDELYRIFGYEPGEVSPESAGLSDAVVEEDRAAVTSAIVHCVETGHPFEQEFRIVRRDGALRWIHGRGLRTVADDGRPVRFVGNAQDVTERRAAQEERSHLARRHEAVADQLSLLLESTGEGIFGVDGDGRCTFVNRAALAMLGFARDDVMGASMHDVIHHTTAEGSPYPTKACPVHRAFRLGEASSVEGEVYWRRDGTSFPVEFSAHPILEDGRPAGAVVSFKDVTHRHEMERELREREALFSGAFDAATTAIALTHAVTNAYVDVNDQLCRMLGYSKEELLRLDWASITHPDDRARSFDEVDAFLSGREELTFIQKRYVRSDGSVISVEMNDALIRDENGEPAYFVSHITDVTEREKAAKALRESQALLQEVIDNSPAAIYIKDAAGRYLLTNTRFRQILDSGDAEAAGKTDYDLLPETIAARVTAHDQEVLARGEALEVEEVVPDVTGELRTFLSVKFPLFDDAGVPDALVGISTDISDRVKAAEEKELLEAQLRQAQKMEAVGRLAGGVAHDFNNILAVILNYGEFVLDDLAEDDPARADVRQIVAAGQRAATLVHQLLAFSRREAVEHRPVDLNQVVDGLRELVARAIGEHIRLEVDCAPALREVKADRGQLEQVLLNLAVNARDAMPDGGVLTLSTHEESVATGGPHGLAPGRYVKLVVSDTGEGIDASIRDHIFEPFFTTKPQGEGTGLGLSTVYGIVNQTHGHIDVASDVGRGTTFEVWLPATDERAWAREEAGPRTVTGPAFGKILVVEDEDAARDLVARILTRNGFDVVTMPSGPLALEWCRGNGEQIDLLLTDVVMPEMSGTTLAQRVAALRSGVRTLYMSGYPGDCIPGRPGAELHGRVIAKPFAAEELVAFVREALSKEAS